MRSYACRRVLLILVVVVAVAAKSAAAVCDSHLTEMIIERKKAFVLEDRDRVIEVSCRTVTSLRRCEGLCRSMAVPSVKTLLTTKKDCKCCSASSTTEKSVTLPCFDGDTLIPNETLSVTVLEPVSCHCARCETS